MYLCLVHDDGGSMYEASCAQQVFGPFDTSRQASDAAKKFEKATDGYGISYWVNIYKIPEMVVTADEALVEWQKMHDYDED